MKQLREWVTASKRNYQSNIFTRTWLNIVIFHTFFVLVMVIVFGYVLYYTKLNIFATLNEMLVTVLRGGTVNAELVSMASQELDRVNVFVLAGMVVFAIATGVTAAHITLVPTREEFAQRKRFITAVAHELRTPLAVLRTSNEVALYDADDAASVRKILVENIEETKNIANILNNLVIFSRVGAEESLTFEPTDVLPSLQHVIQNLLPFAEKSSVAISYVEKKLPLIYANKTALEQIFYNLIKNAVIYSKPKGGTVLVDTFVHNDQVVIQITDTGIGISSKNLKHIFEPFFRINPDDSQSASGTGLGLSLVFEIMKLHRGVIEVESKEQSGTTFTLQFPLYTSTAIENKKEKKNSISYFFGTKA